MPRRKVVFVIVEGPTDDTALSLILNRLYDSHKVYFEIMHGDITTDFRIAESSIVSAIGNLVKNYALAMHFTQKDFLRVIHLVDMDGAYIPDEAIIACPEAVKPFYTLTELRTNKREQMMERNKRKRNVLNRLSSLKTVWVTIPYQIYYMSCNLDHALYNKLNSTDEEKEKDAYAFSRRYKDNLKGFLNFIAHSDFSKMDGYKESWDFIKKDKHSLERFSNFGLCFEGCRGARNEE